LQILQILWESLICTFKKLNKLQRINSEIHNYHIIARLPKDTDEAIILTAARRKCFILYQGFSMGVYWFLIRTVESWRQWDDSHSFKRNGRSRILYPTKLSFKNEGKIMNKQKWIYPTRNTKVILSSQMKSN
jgi:hypothetical protein